MDFGPLRAKLFSGFQLPLFIWPILGTLGCIAVSMLYNAIVFSAYGGEVLFKAMQASIIVPLFLVPGFFTALIFKLKELSVANEKLAVVASTDSLTACLNRGAFTEHVEKWLESRDRMHMEASGALLVIDADHFKKINDRFGHDSGDEALIIIARTIGSVLRDSDLMGRMGGEEFAVFLPDADSETAALVAERIRHAVNMAVFAPFGELRQLSVSIGGAVFSEAADFRDLFQMADRRLYEAKQFGRNRVEFCELSSIRAFGTPSYMQQLAH
jgi:diguanylate cyclase